MFPATLIVGKTVDGVDDDDDDDVVVKFVAVVVVATVFNVFVVNIAFTVVAVDIFLGQLVAIIGIECRIFE